MTATKKKKTLAKSFAGMVTSPHALATQAGLDVLKASGNAVEAAIAIGAALCVTYPQFTGFGGDAFMIISDAAGNTRTISGIGQAPAALPHFERAIPVRGPLSMLTSAGTVDTLGKAFEFSRDTLGGSNSWSRLLTPALLLARDGFPVTASQRFWLDFRAAEMASLPGVVKAYMNDGVAPEVGALLCQPQLAASIELLAERGHRDFYEGKLAALLVKGLREAGSFLRAGDLAATHARLQPPLRVAYRDGELLAHQPPTQGVTTLEIMGILNRFDLGNVKHGSTDFYHLLVEAVKLAFIDRDRHLADPDFSAVAVDTLLSRAHLDTLASRIDKQHARPWPHVFRNGDTVFVAAADAQGNAVSMLQTVYFDWGSGLLVGDTGMLWHNRGAAFSLDPSHPNCLAPRKRPFHTLNPGMYMKNGRPHILYGTQGADGQPQTLATVLPRMIDYGMDPMAALAAPRFLLGKTFSDTRDSLKLEADAGVEVFEELAARGHLLSPIPAQSPLAGHSGAIVIDQQTGAFFGAHDPRSDGEALGV